MTLRLLRPRLSPVYGALISSAIEAMRDNSLVTAIPSDAMRDPRPGSEAISQVNGIAESFPRFGIQNHIPGFSFQFYKVAGDALPGNQGQRVRDATTVVFGLATAAAVVGTIASTFFPLPWIVRGTVLAARLAGTLLGLEVLWRAVSVGTSSSDGVVEGSSQVYPNAILNRRSLDPSSHMAQIDGTKSAEDIKQMIVTRLNVEPRVP